MNKKNKGVSVKVAEEFYRAMEQTRHHLKNKYNIKITSHTKLTRLMSKNKQLFNNKQWINEIKKWKV